MAQRCQKYASPGRKLKIYSELNFVQKSPRAHMSIYPRSGARGLERLTWLKNFNVQKQKFRFTLGLNTAKYTHHMEKSLK